MTGLRSQVVHEKQEGSSPTFGDMMRPVTADSIDNVGTFTFSLADLGNPKAAEELSMVQCVSGIAIQGMTIIERPGNIAQRILS